MIIRISEFFYRHEVACKCGCGADSMDVETLQLADEVRRFNNSPITPTSGHRCLNHNRAIGSEDTSQHVKARALDLPVADPRAVYQYLCWKYTERYGFGLYESFVHVDSRSGPPARWITI
jgi:uncharacterized protein YcbK (DUF882 family)